MTALAGEVVPAQSGGRELSTERRTPLDILIERWLVEVCRAEGVALGVFDPANNTLRAYRSDLRAWLTWCERVDVDPLTAGRTVCSAWIRAMEVEPSVRTGRPLAPATQARRVSAVASFYTFAVDEGVVAKSPVPARGLPRAPAGSSTAALSRDEVRQVRARLAHESPRDRALVLVLLIEGLRVSSATGLTVGAICWREGQTCLRVVSKGARVGWPVVPPLVKMALDEVCAQLAARLGVPADELPADELLFPGAAGRRLSQQAVTRLLRRVCRAAGVAGWRHVSPHMLRHTCATELLNENVPLNVVADHLMHSDVRTTMRYDRARGRASRGAAAVAALVAATEPDQEIQ